MSKNPNRTIILTFLESLKEMKEEDRPPYYPILEENINNLDTYATLNDAELAAKLNPTFSQLTPQNNSVIGNEDFHKFLNGTVAQATVAFLSSQQKAIAKAEAPEEKTTKEKTPEQDDAVFPQLDKIITQRDVVGKSYQNPKSTKEIQKALETAGIIKIVPDAEFKAAKAQAGKGKVATNEEGVILISEDDLGIYGRQTTAAIKQLQKQTVLLKDDGNVGRATAIALKSSAEGKDQNEVKIIVAQELLNDHHLSKKEQRAISIKPAELKNLLPPALAVKDD